MSEEETFSAPLGGGKVTAATDTGTDVGTDDPTEFKPSRQRVLEDKVTFLEGMTAGMDMRITALEARVAALEAAKAS